MSESRTELVHRLAAAGDLYEAFVLLWSYFQTAKIGLVENRLRQKGWLAQSFRTAFLDSLARDDADPEKGNFEIRIDLPEPLKASDLWQALAHRLPGSEAVFAEYALEALIILDKRFGNYLRTHKQRRASLRTPYTNLKGDMCFLRPSDNPVDAYLRELHLLQPPSLLEPRLKQGLSLAPYLVNFQVIQAEYEGIRVACDADWAQGVLHRRLSDAQNKLRIMLWPLASLKVNYSTTTREGQGSTFISLHDVENCEELQVNLEHALEAARRQEVTLLLLPELIMPPTVEARLKASLAANGSLGFPILTLFGRCHTRPDTESLDQNLAVLLGPEGKVLHVHQKLTSFCERDAGTVISEWLETGTSLTVLESPIGQMLILICLDFLNNALKPVLQRLHANLMLVPSMSKTTRPYDGVAQEFARTHWASSFIVNKPYEPDPLCPGNASFYRLPFKGARAEHCASSGQPYLLFDLVEDIRRLLESDSPKVQ